MYIMHQQMRTEQILHPRLGQRWDASSTQVLSDPIMGLWDIYAKEQMCGDPPVPLIFIPWNNKSKCHYFACSGLTAPWSSRNENEKREARADGEKEGGRGSCSERASIHPSSPAASATAADEDDGRDGDDNDDGLCSTKLQARETPVLRYDPQTDGKASGKWYGQVIGQNVSLSLWFFLSY